MTKCKRTLKYCTTAQQNLGFMLIWSKLITCGNYKNDHSDNSRTLSSERIAVAPSAKQCSWRKTRIRNHTVVKNLNYAFRTPRATNRSLLIVSPNTWNISVYSSGSRDLPRASSLCIVSHGITRWKGISRGVVPSLENGFSEPISLINRAH